jgi:hypothetical protein
MTSNFEINKRADKRAAQEEAAMQAWGCFVAKYPQYDGEAFLIAVREDMGDSFLTADEEDFTYAIRTSRTEFRPARIPTQDEKKAELIEEIISLLAAHSRRDKIMLKSEETRMNHWSLDALENRLSELKFKIDSVSTPISDLKSLVANSRADTRKYPGFPDLDKSVDAAHIKNLSTFELKKLIRLHSVSAVNDRLAGKS